MESADLRTHDLVVGATVRLRERLPADVDMYVYWFSHGEWRQWDDPWHAGRAPSTEEEVRDFKQQFLVELEQEALVPRKAATILTLDGKPVGRAVSCREKGAPDECSVGIDICEDEYLNRGIGTEALGLWVDYLFENSDLHRISLLTWSFNLRMMRVAEKLGFVREGVWREAREWQGERIDRVLYGMLRREWESARGGE